MPRVGVNSGAWLGFNHDCSKSDTSYLTSPFGTVRLPTFEVEGGREARMVGA